ncbi:MAG: hypothetical protein KGS72_20115 [Cyanobacteria bacterium REEB67]|nr:hypothetical protein [Cyanobacteria bacterium REEB67]
MSDFSEPDDLKHNSDEFAPSKDKGQSFVRHKAINLEVETAIKEWRANFNLLLSLKQKPRDRDDS